LGDYAYSKNVNFCLEPNPKEYGTDFLNNTKETIEFIKKVNSPGLWLNIDAGTIALNNEPIEETIKYSIPYAKHIHISEPFLNEITNQKLALNEEAPIVFGSLYFLKLVAAELCDIIPLLNKKL
jgi:sugar phosphate isomerase/epimerase